MGKTCYFVEWITGDRIGNCVIYADAKLTGEALVRHIVAEAEKLQPGAAVTSIYRVE